MREPSDPLTFEDPTEWRAWLEQHHASEQEVWLVHTKKWVKPGTLTYEQALEEALCYGWIDGLLRSLDAERFVLRYTPRKRKSIWSEGNRRRVEKLIREGRMAEAGLQKVRQAQESGEWEAAAQREDVSAIPRSLEAALRSREGAWEAFAMQSPSHKKQYLWWIADAKREDTRRKRIEATVDRVLGLRLA